MFKLILFTLFLHLKFSVVVPTRVPALVPDSCTNPFTGSGAYALSYTLSCTSSCTTSFDGGWSMGSRPRAGPPPRQHDASNMFLFVGGAEIYRLGNPPWVLFGPAQPDLVRWLFVPHTIWPTSLRAPTSQRVLDALPPWWLLVLGLWQHWELSVRHPEHWTKKLAVSIP